MVLYVYRIGLFRYCSKLFAVDFNAVKIDRSVEGIVTLSTDRSQYSLLHRAVPISIPINQQRNEMLLFLRYGIPLQEIPSFYEFNVLSFFH
jgi:hypothetical protein